MSSKSRWQTFIISRWGGSVMLVGKYVSVQVIVQAMGFISGLLIIRFMSQKEYAYYTIANTMQGTMNLLADMGIGIGISAMTGLINTMLLKGVRKADESLVKATPIVRRTLPHHEALDGMRGCAILPVMLFHAQLPVFKGGFIGVDVFLFCRGFLLPLFCCASGMVRAKFLSAIFTSADFCD